MTKSIQISNILLNNNDASTGQSFNFIPSTNIKYTPVELTKNIFILNNSQLTSKINFINSIQKTYGTSSLPSSSLFTYTGSLNVTSSASITALYELVRGYLYRDDSYTAQPSIPTLITSKTSGSTISGFRFITFDKSIKAERIKKGTFRVSIAPINITSTNPYGLRLSNSGATSDTTTGKYAAIINDWSTSGSLLNGVSGSVLTGFTVLMKIKPEIGGPNTQTLFHRRVGDSSSSAVGVGVQYSDFDNKINFYHYGLLKPSSLECSASAFVDTALTSWGLTGVNFITGLYYFGTDVYSNELNFIGLTAFFNPVTNTFSGASGSITSSSTAAVIKIMNVGGGLVRIGYDEGAQLSGNTVNKSFITISTGSNTYYQLGNNTLTSTIHAIDNLNSHTATITCSVDFSSRVTSLYTPTTSTTQYQWTNNTQTYIWNLKIFEGLRYKNSYKDSIDQFINIPIRLTVVPMVTTQVAS
jgi:hypothetical protein